jgi:ketosteroid isomerase-like protein
MKSTRLVIVVALVVSAVLAASISRAHVPDPRATEAKPNVGLVPASTMTTATTASIIDFERRYREALEKSDLAAFQVLHHKDVIIFESGHKNVGWEDYEKNHLKPEIDETKSLMFTKWESAGLAYGDTAIVIADIGYAIELNDGAKHAATGVVTLVLRPRGGIAGKPWEIVHTHWSTVRRKG